MCVYVCVVCVVYVYVCVVCVGMCVVLLCVCGVCCGVCVCGVLCVCGGDDVVNNDVALLLLLQKLQGLSCVFACVHASL